MSSLLRPVGPQPPGVYWVRRLLVLVVVLLVVGLSWWLFLRPSSGSPPTGSAGPSGSPSVSASPSPTTTTSTTPSASPSESSPSTSPSPSSSVPPCRASAIAVSVTTDQQRYRPDEQPVFTLGVENTGDVTCLRDVGQQALELRVTAADGTQVWSSDDCNPGGPSAIRTFGPGDRWTLPVTWSRQESAQGCPAGEPDAPAGEYEVIARNLSALSPAAAFTLR